jgi:hypothetical protein
MKRHFTNSILMPVKPFATVPGLLKLCDILWLEVPIQAFIQPDDTESLLLFVL